MEIQSSSQRDVFRYVQIYVVCCQNQVPKQCALLEWHICCFFAECCQVKSRDAV